MTRLAVGAPAPDFTLPDFRGHSVSLAEHRGRPVWVAFFRYASCPFCNLRVHRTIERKKEGGLRGIDLLAIFQSPPESMAEYVGKQDPPFAMLCDPSEAIYARYGLEQGAGGFVNPALVRDGIAAARLGYLALDPDGTFTRIPADFLVNPDGTIGETYYGSHASDHIPFGRVESFVARATEAHRARAVGA